MLKIGDVTTTANSSGEFTAGSAAAGVPSTLIRAEWLNAVQRELIAILTAAGVSPSADKSDQVITALLALTRQGGSGFAADTGAANAYACAFTPAITSASRAEGQVLRFKVKTTNSGASTFNDGGGALPLVGGAHSALQGGELFASGDAWVQFNGSIGANGSYILLFCTGAPEQVAAATKSQHAVNLGQLSTLKGVQRFNSSGSFTVPAGVNQIWVSGCAAGGGGGATLATNASSYLSGGSGGGAGQSVLRVAIAVTPGQVIPVTIGAAGVGGTPASNNATSGGATQLGTAGALLNLLGGGPGLLGTGGTSVANYGGPAGGYGYPSGSPATDTTVYSGGIAMGGNGGVGGSTPFGLAGGPGRGAYGGSNVAGAGYGYGAGGSGAGGAYASPATAVGAAGAAGLPGFLIIEW